MENTDFIRKEKARAQLFNLFSGLFCQPEKKLLQQPELFISLGQSMKTMGLETGTDLDELKHALNHYSEKELLVEYTRLFIGPFKTFVPPYSSVYLGDGSVMGEDSLWVLKQYQKMGIEIKTDTHDLPDHISVETSYIYFLIHKEVEHLSADNHQLARIYFDSQKEFLSRHFNLWVPKFCQAGLKHTENTFYRSLFILLEHFTHSNLSWEMAMGSLPRNTG